MKLHYCPVFSFAFLFSWCTWVRACHLVMSHSLWPHRLRSATRLLCPWNFPGKNTEVGNHFLLQGIFPTQTGIKPMSVSCVSCIGRQILYHWATWESPSWATHSFFLNFLNWYAHKIHILGLPRWLSGKESACQAGDAGSTPGSGTSPGEGNGNPLQYSCLGNPIDRGDWRATVHGVAKSQTRLSDYTHDNSNASLLGQCVVVE